MQRIKSCVASNAGLPGIKDFCAYAKIISSLAVNEVSGMYYFTSLKSPFNFFNVSITSSHKISLLMIGIFTKSFFSISE